MNTRWVKILVRAMSVALFALLGAVLVMAGPRIWDEIQLGTGWGLPGREGPPLLIIAHHGDLEAYPENTAESIWAAAVLQPDGIEVDVNQSASGTWYVIHDPTLDRTTDGHGKISALSDDEIEAAIVDAGLGFTPNKGSVFHVPTLESVLLGLTGFSGTIYIDVQHADSGDPATILDLTRGMNVTIICRSEADAAAIKARDIRVETLLSVTLPGGQAVDGVIAEATLHGSPSLIESLKVPVTMYVERPNQEEFALLRRAWATGVTAFITNHLEAALAARDTFAADQP
jgi:glycerophosphoryl diester phosphodiesterase